jgi:hypothetical protein
MALFCSLVRVHIYRAKKCGSIIECTTNDYVTTATMISQVSRLDGYVTISILYVSSAVAPRVHLSNSFSIAILYFGSPMTYAAS